MVVPSLVGGVQSLGGLFCLPCVTWGYSLNISGLQWYLSGTRMGSEGEWGGGGLSQTLPSREVSGGNPGIPGLKGP